MSPLLAPHLQQVREIAISRPPAEDGAAALACDLLAISATWLPGEQASSLFSSLLTLVPSSASGLVGTTEQR